MLKFRLQLLFIILTSIFTACGGGQNSNNKELTINERYPMPWTDPGNAEMMKVSRSLVKNNITGCGEYYVRNSAVDDGECLVACTPDGENWNYYIVWYNIENVSRTNSGNIEKPY